MFLREGLRPGKAPGSTCGAGLIRASCCADRETEARKKKKPKTLIQVTQHGNQSQARYPLAALCQALLCSGSGNLEQEAVFCPMVVKYITPPPLSCLGRPCGMGLSHPQGGMAVQSLSGRCVRMVNSVGHQLYGKWKALMNVGPGMRTLEDGLSQVSLGGAGGGWMLIQSREPR